MIFVTVGHQMPFDRLIRAVDAWARSRNRDDIVAQVGESSIKPRHMLAQQFMTPDEFRSAMQEADAIVGHAGTGTIIAALQYRKPLLVLPRLAKLGETRNDHQIPTARHFADAGYILAGFDEDEFIEKLDAIEQFQPSGTISESASPQLIQTLREFVVRDTRAKEIAPSFAKP